MGCRRGVASIEFAITASVALLLCLGTIDVGVLLWTRNALQLAAAQAARCAAIASPACAGGTSSYAATLAQQWLFPSAVQAANVTVTSGATCSATAGHYVVVSITTSYFTTLKLPGPLGGRTISAQACYPSAL